MTDNEKLKELQSNMDSPDITPNSPDNEWAPIRPKESRSQATRTKPASRASSTHSLGRQRSHNYWSCDENIENDGEDEDIERGGEEKNPFEVTWEDGERDPMNPRSKSKPAKWAIVLICSLASFCVYAISDTFSSIYLSIYICAA